MTPFRPFQVSIVAVNLIAHVWIVQAHTATPPGSSLGASGANSGVAVARIVQAHVDTPGPSSGASGASSGVAVAQDRGDVL